MSRAIVLVSPGASRGSDPSKRDRVAAAIRTALSHRGLTAEFPETGSAEEAEAVLHGAAEAGYELAVVAGGDGSVRLAVHALAGTPIPLGIVPLGTGNLLAATLGIPREPLVAAVRLADAQRVTIDTGLLVAGDVREAFAVAAGVGFDARVVEATGRAAKARFGVLAYFGTILRMIPALPTADTEIVVDGRTYQLTTVAVLVANCGQIVPGILGPRAPLDPTDGLLDVIAIKGGSTLSALPIAAASALDSLFRGAPGEGGASLRLQGLEITVRTDPPEPVQVDGDLLPVGDGMFRATAQPRSLTVLV